MRFSRALFLLGITVTMASYCYGQSPTPVPTPYAEEICARITIDSPTFVEKGILDLQANSQLRNSEGTVIGRFLGQSPNGSLTCWSISQRPRDLVACPNSTRAVIKWNRKGKGTLNFNLRRPYFLLALLSQDSRGYGTSRAILNVNKETKEVRSVDLIKQGARYKLRQRVIGTFEGLCNGW